MEVFRILRILNDPTEKIFTRDIYIKNNSLTKNIYGNIFKHPLLIAQVHVGFSCSYGF